MEPKTYSNPRLTAEFNDWPLGGGKHGLCTFRVEHKTNRGVRVVRQTFGRPKADTYVLKAAIVDGSDGRTYSLQLTEYGFIKVRRSDFMDEENIFPDSPRYAEIKALLDATPSAWGRTGRMPGESS